MSVIVRNLHIKLQEEDNRLLNLVCQHHAHDTDSQTVRVLIRQEARRLGITDIPAVDTMPVRGRKAGKKSGEKS